MSRAPGKPGLGTSLLTAGEDQAFFTSTYQDVLSTQDRIQSWRWSQVWLLYPETGLKQGWSSSYQV